MLFLIIVIVLYIFLENIFKINLNDGKHKKLLKFASIIGLSAVIVNLIYDKSLPNVIFVCLLIYIVSNTRKDSLYEYMSNTDNFENFENEYKIDSDYYKYYRNKEDSLSRVFNDDYDENHYTLDNLYPKEEEEEEEEDTPDKDNKHEVHFHAGYDNELKHIKKNLMNKFWLIDNNNSKYKIKEEQKCTTTLKPTKMITTTTKPPKTGLCYFFDKVFGLFL
jgi:hypothetical protein